MFFLYTCTAGHGPLYQVLRVDEDAHLLGLSMRCPVNNCEGHLEVVSSGEGLEVSRVSANALFMASRGFGFEEERHAGPEHLKALLSGATILEVGIEEETSTPKRSTVSSLLISHGEGSWHRVYFGSSPHGAIAFRIEKVT